ncbi:hypothetical protein POM88_022429 [Heracleum sosnowskyi]|uniref:Uncharacterized protein n=1 Tax=Heracleum sosnowskyi TaxID=360622 RepID=A0AAD8MTN0_9APIA|nr:hypothetical protein POM88_022429 [Heracleum sosnowskyi]
MFSLQKKTNSYVEKQLLRFDDHLDSLSDYNWAEYLLNSLVVAVQSWNRSASVFFNDSLIFLTLLYVDRVRHKGIKLVERLTLFYKGGPKKSSERNKRLSCIMGSLELINYNLQLYVSFEKFLLFKQKNIADENARDWNDYDNFEQGQYDDIHDNDTEQHYYESSEKNFNDGNDYNCDQEWAPWNYVSHHRSDRKAARAQDIMAAKDKFFEDLNEDKKIYGDDIYLLSIEQVMNEVFHPSTTNDAELVVINEQEQNPSTTNKYVFQVAADFELRPEDIEQLEIMEYLNSTQARIDMPDIFEKDLISIAGQDIEEEDAEDFEREDDDDFVSPTPILRKKSTRLVKHLGLNVDMNVTESYPIFAENMGYILNRYERKLDNVDMVLFLINKHGHFYLICYNLKKEGFDLIDNIKRRNPKQCYGQTPNILHSHFTGYLKENGLVNLAKRMQKLQPSFLRMQWQTKGFSEFRKIQDNQIIRLGVKYNNTILSSNLKEMKDEILNEVKQLFNKGAEKRLMNMVAQVSAAKSNNTRNNKGKGANRKTVTFAANLARSFDEAKT